MSIKTRLIPYHNHETKRKINWKGHVFLTIMGGVASFSAKTSLIQ